jgi:hypothetical protein
MALRGGEPLIGVGDALGPHAVLEQQHVDRSEGALASR